MSDVCAPLNRLLHIGIVLSTAAFVTVQTVIDQHEVRDGMSRYIFDNGTQRNCVPILDPDFCAEGHQIEPCFRDNEKDRCVPCSDGEVQLDKTYSNFKSPCYIISCPEGSIPGERNPSSACSWPCKCQSERMVMNQHCSCQRVEVQCGSNTYLKNGVCWPCPAGTHKPGNGAGPCVAKMSPISHTSEPVTATAPVSTASPGFEIITTSGVQRNLIKNITGKNKTNGDLATEEKPPNHRSSNDQNKSLLYITIATLAVVLLVMLLSVTIIHKLRTRKLPKHNTAQPNDSNESLVQPQVAEVGGYTRVPMSDPPPYSSHEVHMADEDTQGMALPWTKSFTDQTTGGNQAEGGAEITVHERDTDETDRKEYHNSGQTPADQQDPNTAETLRKSNRYLDAGRGSFPTLESTEQDNSVMSVTCKDADDTSIKKTYMAPSRNEKNEASSEHVGPGSPPRLGSAPALNTDSFKSDLEK